MSRFRLERVINASVERVWDAADFTKSAGPYPMEVVNSGDPVKNGAGFTRAVRSGNKTIIERLLSVDPLKSYTYTLAEGAPVKEGYLGKLELTPEGDATKITWSGTFTPKLPGSGWLCTLVIKSIASKIVDSIEAECLNSD